MYQLIIAEKPSVAQSIAAVLGAKRREHGYLEGSGYLVSWCFGHLAELSNDLDGFFSPSKQSITLRDGMSEVQTVCAAVHEIAHSKLHDYAKQQDSHPKDSSTEEIEAESIAYTVCAYFGIETSANSFGYVATWSKDKDLKAFKDSLDTIRKTSSELISGVEQQFKEICNLRSPHRSSQSRT